ncbi:hypothetical protein MTBBW1_2410014 [Desulfamplus magnetovallimortis]|uniref:Uncharacterized protein n=1 Tax=Desulfamplus magnetovallimortis TaxID=1246637 RepID=A0A1W1HED2_9BACT|nr:hypothetical protein MTBBW1_2410014 [Desulfamplus magnetovallimortis]
MLATEQAVPLLFCKAIIMSAKSMPTKIGIIKILLTSTIVIAAKVLKVLFGRLIIASFES